MICLYLILFCIGLHIFRLTDGTNCFKGGRIVMRALRCQVWLCGNGKWFTWLTGQIGGPLAEFCLGSKGGQDWLCILPYYSSIILAATNAIASASTSQRETHILSISKAISKSAQHVHWNNFSLFVAAAFRQHFLANSIRNKYWELAIGKFTAADMRPFAIMKYAAYKNRFALQRNKVVCGKGS